MGNGNLQEDEGYEEKQEYFKKIDLKILEHFKKGNDLTPYQRLLIEHLVSHESDSQRERIDQAA